MNGVRRLLAVASSASSPTAPPSESKAIHVAYTPANGSSWPQSPVVQATPQTPPQTTPPMFRNLKEVDRQKQQPPLPPEDDPFSSNAAYGGSISGSPASTTSTPHRTIKRKSPPQAQTLTEIDWKHVTGSGVSSTTTTNVRDELLMSLLASQALVDSRDLEILTSEQVDELKKV